MELVEDIVALSEAHNIRSEVDLVRAIDSDNYVFKRLIKTLVYHKLRQILGDEFDLSSPIESTFPRTERKTRFDHLQSVTKLTLPKLELSSHRRILLLVSFLIPATVFTILILNNIELFLIPYTDFGLVVYVFLCSLPSVLITVVDKKFFQPLDLPGIGDVNDLLDGLVTINWQAYREDSFQRTIAELKEIFPSFLMNK
ncbi:MAG: hypothetical protein JST14_00110 [Bacteroidetes bacterium]|nr:hypothetical protein [Bacteroidota bacterium]